MFYIHTQAARWWEVKSIDDSNARIPDAEAITLFRERPGVWLTFAGSAFLALYAERLRPIGLKPNWVIALAIISEHPKISQSALARALRINRASGMALATILEERGYILRHVQSGRNQLALTLSGEGRRKLIDACTCEEELVAETMRDVDPEALAGFVAMLKAVASEVNRAGA
jgi:DNA-binding MarR family transcriptional regulator